MSIDTIVFLEVALSGFMAVWVFRRYTGANRQMGEFEWLGLSIFWGLVILGTYNSLSQSAPQLKQLQQIFNNPLEVGAALSLVGALLGLVAGWAILRLHQFIKFIKSKKVTKK